MAVQYLLDTNTVGYVLRGDPPAVRTRLALLPQHRVGISVVTEAELRFGVANAPQATRLNALIESFLAGTESVHWNSAAARRYGVLRAALRKHGITIGNLDLLIAAQALSMDSVLVSHDLALGHVPDLKLEDWTLALPEAH